LSLLLSDLVKSHSDVPVKEKIVKQITEKGRFKELSIEKKLLLAKQALKLLNSEISSKLLMVVGMAFYLSLLVAPFVLTAIIGATFLN
jgi:tmRNA-binding protein